MTTTVDIDDVLNTLKEERRVVMDSQAGLYGKLYIIDKLIQYYAELKEDNKGVSK